MCTWQQKVLAFFFLKIMTREEKKSITDGLMDTYENTHSLNKITHDVQAMISTPPGAEAEEKTIIVPVG